jgi:putative oxidoreductase
MRYEGICTMKFLSGFEAPAYAALRIVSGLLFSCHGAQKLFGAFGGHSALNNPRFLAAGIIEFGAGILILLGLFSSLAAFIASGEMAVAYFMVHFGWGPKFFPITNGGELAVLYCFLFFFIACHGPGKFAVRKN